MSIRSAVKLATGIIVATVLLAGCKGATTPATSVTAISAIVHASGICQNDKGTTDGCSYQFRYRPVGSSSWKLAQLHSGIGKTTVLANLSEPLYGLSQDTTYE